MAHRSLGPKPNLRARVETIGINQVWSSWQDILLSPKSELLCVGSFHTAAPIMLCSHQSGGPIPTVTCFFSFISEGLCLLGAVWRQMRAQ